jgi:hypothetical protein
LIQIIQPHTKKVNVRAKWDKSFDDEFTPTMTFI